MTETLSFDFQFLAALDATTAESITVDMSVLTIPATHVEPFI